MNLFRILYAVIPILLLMGCKSRPDALEEALNVAENILTSNPDSAQSILKGIHLMDDDIEAPLFARWCILTSKVADKLYIPIPLTTDQCEQAYLWYSSNGSSDETISMLLYWGRAYVAEGNDDEAMKKYTQALETARHAQSHNWMGYIYSYMGDLYENKDLCHHAIEKYKEASLFFLKAGNHISYTYALRDLGREYAFVNNLSEAMKTMQKADSMANVLGDKHLKGSVINSLGNIYRINGQYQKAEDCFLIALESGIDNEPNYIALIYTYLAQKNYKKATQMLQQMEADAKVDNYAIRKIYGSSDISSDTAIM